MSVKCGTEMFDFQKATGGDDRLVITPLPKENQVAKPEHYRKGISPYDVGETMYGYEGLLHYVTINSIKYIQRYPHKYKGIPEKQLEDLIKARESLDTAIELHKKIYGDGQIRHG